MAPTVRQATAQALARRPAPCVRCGRRPRSRETFLCDPCLSDPQAVAEVREVQALAASFPDQRRLTIERYHWAGGWGRDL